MNTTTSNRGGLDARRRRALYRAWHRGMREMDLILGPFADGAVAGFSNTELEAFEALLAHNDQDLFQWIVSGAKPPAGTHTAMIERIIAARKPVRS